MDQKEIIHRYYMVGTSTLDKVMQVLSHLSMEGLIKLKDSRLPLQGEINVYKLMSRSDPLTSAFLNNKVDLTKLKGYLEEQSLPFSFKETPEGTTLYFRVKDKELAKKALERVITGIKKSPSSVLKTPGKMTFEEKVAYAKSQPKYKGTITKQPLPGKGRGL